MRPLVVAVSVMLLTPAIAYAEPPRRRDRLGVAVDMTYGGGLHLGEISRHADRKTWITRLGVGLGRGRTAFLLSFSAGQMGDLDESGVPTGFLELGVEPSVRHELTRGSGWRVHLRGGWRWRWLLAEQELARTCTVNGGCDAGYYRDSPAYGAHGPTLAVGIGGRIRGDVWTAFGLELAIGHALVRRPGTNPDLDDTVVTLGFNVALGRGAH